MRKAQKLIFIGIVGFVVTGNAQAAPQHSADWTGLYVGANLGYGWGRADTSFAQVPAASVASDLASGRLNVDSNGAVAGVDISRNWQAGNYIYGAAGDFSLSGMKGTKTSSPIILYNGAPFAGGGSISSSEETDWFGTIRGRAGWAPLNQLFVYGTGGLAVGHVKYSANVDPRPSGTYQYPTSFSKLKTGWTLGVGAEWVTQKNWSTRFEYLYYDLGSESRNADASPSNPPYQVAYKWETKASILRVGLEYRFR